MRSQALRTFRNITISIVLLLVLLVGGGLGYTYFLGPDASQAPAAATPPPPPAKAKLTPPKADPRAPVSASVQMLTSPVAPGNNASINVKTTPAAACKVAVMYGTAPAVDSGLAAKTADEFGTVSWTWTVASTAELGTWPVKVTCVVGAKSAVVQGDLVVAKQ